MINAVNFVHLKKKADVWKELILLEHPGNRTLLVAQEFLTLHHVGALIGVDIDHAHIKFVLI